MGDVNSGGTPDWKTAHGLRIIRSGQLDTNTPQTPGDVARGSDFPRQSGRAKALGGDRGGATEC